MPINVLKHPLVNSKLTGLREAKTSNAEFRAGISDLSTILAIEASRDIEEEPIQGTTPVGPFQGSRIKPRIGLAPILRAGLGMTDAFLRFFPEAHVYHLGLFREKVSLQPVEYYSKLPSELTVDTVFLLDPLIATGGTAVAALNMIIDWGIPIQRVKFLAILSSQKGLQNVQSEFPDLEIWTCAVDSRLTDDGLIYPGLGDTGDRTFNTPHSAA